MTSAVQVIPLGGLGEIGMNALALVSNGEAIVIDCGVTFDDRGLGIDVVHADFSALDAFHVRGRRLGHGAPLPVDRAVLLNRHFARRGKPALL